MSAQQVFSGGLPVRGAGAACGARHEVSASLFLAYLAHFDRYGTRGLVRARLPGATAQLFERPPAPTGWLPRGALDDVYAAVARDGGEDAVRELTFEAGLSTYGALLRRGVRDLVGVADASPGQLLTSLGAVAALYERGTRHTWRASGARAGKVEVALVEAAPRLAFVAWEGLYSLVFELTRCAGTVTLAGLAQEGRQGRYHLSW